MLALLVPESLAAARVAEVIRSSAGTLLESVEIESDYRGPELPSGTRSVAFRLTFRAPDRTLRDTEIDQAESRLLAVLEAELGIRRRDAGVSRGGD